MKDPTDITIETYNRTAHEFEKKAKNLHHVKEEKKFEKYLQPGSSILDLGCGDGRDAKIFSERGFKVTGIDLSDKMLDLARTKVALAIFKKMDIRNLEFPDNSFEGIWAVASLLHIPKKEIHKALSESYRVLKKKGIIYICVKVGEGEELKPDKRYDESAFKFYSYFQPTELERFVKKSGFKILESKKIILDNEYIKHPEIRLFARKE